ncbi:MAG: DsbA family protein, partial [Cyanobacteria bacterium J06642_2]
MDKCGGRQHCAKSDECRFFSCYQDSEEKDDRGADRHALIAKLSIFPAWLTKPKASTAPDARKKLRWPFLFAGYVALWRNTRMRKAPLLAAVILTLGTVPAASAEDVSFEDRVRAYILDNPEVIVEALQILAEREARAATIAKLEAFPDLFTDDARLGEGAADAPLRIVELFDYKCVPCKTVHPTLVSFAQQHPEIRIEMRHLPILTPGSERAARFALATQMTYGNDAYRAVHDELWEIRGPLNPAGFQRVANALSLDFQKIAPAMESEAVTARINYNRDVAI